MGDELTLRPVRETDFPAIERLTGEPDAAGEFAWFGWRDNRAVRRRWEENRLLAPDRGILIVADGEDVIGFVSWQKARQRSTSYCWNIGIALIPEMQGMGYGGPAQLMLARYLFAHSTVDRVEAETEAANVAEQRALEKAGFTREGLQRSVVFRDGKWRDGVTYSILRSECRGR